MFFLITHVIVGKYYPKFFTQFIIGCTFYAISFMAFRDFVTVDTYEKYKYHILSLIIIDVSFLLYIAKLSASSNETVLLDKMSIPEKKLENNIIDNQTDTGSIGHNKPTCSNSLLKSNVPTGSMQSITLSSEINDFKITHDISSSDNNYDLFSTSDEKSETSNTKILGSAHSTSTSAIHSG